ncbi:MAG: amidohydrolase [Dictyoglomus sp.]|nr:amidohydrolase [Dictyoglomus sp.]MCX7846236.1 amidohydrolase [Dictyoglomaceae bacterium]MDW8189059.1 amidohydrolase family protein [Dictyoglomus sp.]
MSERKILVIGNKIYTQDENNPEVNWILIKNDTIIDLGKGNPPISPNFNIFDFSSFYGLPGFIDSHVHLANTALTEIFLDLSSFTSIEDILKALEAIRDNTPKGEWIVAKEFDPQNVEEKRDINREELDKNFPFHPVFIIRKDSHSSIVNTLAEKLLDVPSLEEKEDNLLKARAHQIAIGKVYQKIDPSLLIKGIIKITRKAIEKGITTIHTLEGGYTSPPNTPNLLLGIEHYLPLQLVIYYQTTSISKVKSINLPRIGGCLLIDGSVSSKTAAFFEPYQGDENNYGILYWEPETLENFIKSAHNDGLQISFHAVGDRGIDLLLKAYKKILKNFPREDHRHRIEHFEYPRNEHIKLARDLGLNISVQPSFLHFWGGEEKLYENYLGKERAKRIIPLRELYDEGVILGGGSDSSITPLDPLLGIHSAINHPNPNESLNVFEAIRIFTYNGAYLAFLEKKKGSLAIGKIADIVFLNKDPFLVKPKDFYSSLEVVATISKGQLVYKKEDLRI